MVDKNTFCDTLKECSLEKMRLIPKCDMHNHAGRGGDISYLEKFTNVKLVPRREKFDSLDDMDMWFKHNICRYLPVGVENYLKRVEANFVAAKKDNIIRLALDFGYGEIFALGGMENFVRTIEKMHKQFASDIEMIPTLVIRDCSRLDRLAEILSFDWYKAIDIINYNDSLSLEIMKYVCDVARSNGLKCKAHIGEYGTAEDVELYVEELELDEVQHGIKVLLCQDLVQTKMRYSIS